MSKNNSRTTNQRNSSSGGKSSRNGMRDTRKMQGMQREVMGTPYSDQDSLRTKQDRRAADAANTSARMSRGNPVSYYTKYSQLATDAAKLPFSAPLGQTWDVTARVQWADGTNKTLADEYTVPGIMRLEFIPTIGVSKDFASPINRASIRFYTYLRSNQKASASYDHQDVTMMEVSLDSCYMFHGLMTRIYGVLNSFTPMNEYYPRALCIANNVSFDDLRMHIQDFRAYINAFAYSLGQYALPKDMELFNRHRWMVEGLYTDSTSTRAQTYMFVPTGFWQYNNTVTTGSQAEFVRWISEDGAYDGRTFEYIKALGDQLLNAISNEEDFAIISGDIYNFYGGENYKLPYVDEGYKILPKYDQIVLSQIENATIMGPVDPSSLIITQNPTVNGGAILFQPKMASGAQNHSKVWMNFHWDSPTSDQVIEASRLIATADLNSPRNVTMCGTEMVVCATIIRKSHGTYAFQLLPAKDAEVLLPKEVVLSTLLQEVQQISYFQQFDWSPRLSLWYADESQKTGGYLGNTWDIDNLAEIPVNYLQNINLAAMLSLFDVIVNRE